MTFEEYIVKCREACRNLPTLRVGQVYFNILCEVKPNYFIQNMCEAGVDPFMKGERFPMFLSWVQKHWED